MRIYIDTSVISALHTKDIRIKEITKQFFASAQYGRFTLYGSEIVAAEIRNTPVAGLREALIKAVDDYSIEILPVTEEIGALADRYVKGKIVPLKYRADAVHIACCVIHNIPILVSWNFKHIVKHKTRIEINKINQILDLPQIDLCSPEEV